MEKGKLGAIIAIVGGALSIIGAITPWVEVSMLGSVSGVKTYGLFVLLLAIPIIIVSALSFKYSKKGLGIAAVSMSGLSLVMVILGIASPSVSGTVLGQTITIPGTVQWGVFFSLVAVLATLGGALLIMLEGLTGTPAAGAPAAVPASAPKKALPKAKPRKKGVK